MCVRGRVWECTWEGECVYTGVWECDGECVQVGDDGRTCMRGCGGHVRVNVWIHVCYNNIKLVHVRVCIDRGTHIHVHLTEVFGTSP